MPGYTSPYHALPLSGGRPTDPGQLDGLQAGLREAVQELLTNLPWSMDMAVKFARGMLQV